MPQCSALSKESQRRVILPGSCLGMLREQQTKPKKKERKPRLVKASSLQNGGNKFCREEKGRGGWCGAGWLKWPCEWWRSLGRQACPPQASASHRGPHPASSGRATLTLPHLYRHLLFLQPFYLLPRRMALHFSLRGRQFLCMRRRWLRQTGYFNPTNQLLVRAKLPLSDLIDSEWDK